MLRAHNLLLSLFTLMLTLSHTWPVRLPPSGLTHLSYMFPSFYLRALPSLSIFHHLHFSKGPLFQELYLDYFESKGTMQLINGSCSSEIISVSSMSLFESWIIRSNELRPKQDPLCCHRHCPVAHQCQPTHCSGSVWNTSLTGLQARRC